MSAGGGVLFFRRMLLISSVYVYLSVCAYVLCMCAEGKVKSGQHEWG